MTSRDRSRRGSDPDVGELADLVTPMAIRVAATLRIADHLCAGLQTAEELARAVPADADALDRLLRHLAHVGVVRRDDVGRYSLAPLGQALRDDHETGVRARLDTNGPLGRAELAFVHLLDSVRTGEASFASLHGRSFWEDVAADPARTAAYDEQMGSDVAAWARWIVPAYDWGALGHVVDVGGGNGSLIAALLHAYPGLHGTVFDQPRTAEAARANLEEAGLGDRSQVVAGDFFRFLPPGAGGYVLSAILHDWNDTAARTLLGRCSEAAGAQGRVLVVEKTGRGGESPRTDMDLRMLVYFGGRERGVSALSALAESAGLRAVAVHPAGELSVLEFRAT